MITEATISILGVIVVLVTAVGFYATTEKRPGRGIYALMVAFALMHLFGDGILRASVGNPSEISMRTLNGLGTFVFMLYVIGLIGVLQAAFDIVWSMTREKVGGGTWFALHLPALVVVCITGLVGDVLMGPVLRYMPLLYTLILFFITVWFYEKLGRGLRVATIVTMVGCVLFFLSNEILHITHLPMMVLVLLMSMGFAWMGRGEASMEEEESEYARPETRREPEKEPAERPKMKPKPERLELESDNVSEPVPTAQPAAATEVTSDTMTTIELAELEELMQKAEIGERAMQFEADPVPMPVEQMQEMHNLPLMMEKNLNEYYHRMHVAVQNKEYDTCLEIMSEMSEYRISGIHLTRHERIRHAVLDEQWKEVEKELKDF